MYVFVYVLPKKKKKVFVNVVSQTLMYYFIILQINNAVNGLEEF